MKLMTTVHIPSESLQIHQARPILSLGSCFSEDIGKKLAEGGFRISVNPFGILYNPVSIADTLDHIVENRKIGEDDLVFHNGHWYSWKHHGRFVSTDKQDLMDTINRSIEDAHVLLKDLDLLVITLGTAHCFRHIRLDRIVANCHKVPATEFKRIMLHPGEIMECLAGPLERLNARYGSLRMCFTVSPIRHWRDGAAANMRSKAALFCALQELEARFSNIVYFPSYEIMMDELRDYRYYDRDMIHPSEQAVDYIFDRFREVHFSEEGRRIYERVLKLKKAAGHRPLNANDPAYETFRMEGIREAERLEAELPFLDLSGEKDLFKA